MFFRMKFCCGREKLDRIRFLSVVGIGILWAIPEDRLSVDNGSGSRRIRKIQGMTEIDAVGYPGKLCAMRCWGGSIDA